MAVATTGLSKFETLLGAEAEYLLGHTSTTISKERLYLPGPTYVSDVFSQTDRNPQVLRSL